MGRTRRKAPRRAPKRPPTPAPPVEASPPLPPPAESQGSSPASPSSSSKSGDELAELEVQLRRDEIEDAPPALTGELHELAPAVAGAPKEGIDLPPAEFMRNMAKTVFAIVALRFGPHWELTDREAGMLGEASAPLGARMLAHVEGIWVELGVVSVVLFPIMVPRLQKEAELARIRAERPEVTS